MYHVQMNKKEIHCLFKICTGSEIKKVEAQLFLFFVLFTGLAF